MEKYENAADEYKRGKFAYIRKAAMAYDLNYNTLYKVCYSYPRQVPRLTSCGKEVGRGICLFLSLIIHAKNEFCGGDGYLGKKKLTENLA